MTIQESLAVFRIGVICAFIGFSIAVIAVIGLLSDAIFLFGVALAAYGIFLILAAMTLVDHGATKT